MYSLIYNKNGKLCFEIFDTWFAAIAKFNQLSDKVNITNLHIKDHEYDVIFNKKGWERRDNLLGWAGGKA